MLDKIQNFHSDLCKIETYLRAMFCTNIDRLSSEFTELDISVQVMDLGRLLELCVTLMQMSYAEVLSSKLSLWIKSTPIA